MSFKRAKIVMLPTNKEAKLFMVGDKLEYKLSFTEHGQKALTIGLNSAGYPAQALYILSDERIEEGDWCYIKWGTNISGKDLFVVGECTKIGPAGIHYFDKLGLSYGKHESNLQKIIASTDKSLHCEILPFEPGEKVKYKYIPQPSDAFIQKYVSEYNKGNIITEVMVEYIISHDLRTSDKEKEFTEVLKIINNTITIRKIKNNWTREEVIAIYKANCERLTNSYISSDIEWIENQLL